MSSGVLVLAMLVGTAGADAKPPDGYHRLKRVNLPLKACGGSPEAVEMGMIDVCRGYVGDFDGDRDDDVLVMHHWCGASQCFSEVNVQIRNGANMSTQPFPAEESPLQGELIDMGTQWMGHWHMSTTRRNGVADLCWVDEGARKPKACWRRNLRTSVWHMLKRQSAARRQAPTGCDSNRFVGAWSVTTRVYKGAKRKASGVNGYYYVHLSGSGCQLQAKVTKVGYAAGGAVREFAAHKRQSGAGVLTIDPRTQSGSVTVNLARPNGGYVQGTTLVLRAGKGYMDGVWHYTGTMWNESRMRGSLRGQRNAKQYPAHRKLSDVGCWFQCALRCEVVKPKGVPTPVTNQAGWESCQRRCQQRPNAAIGKCR